MRCERPVEAGLLIGAPNEKTLGDEKYVHDVQILMYRKKENGSQRNISIETFLFDWEITKIWISKGKFNG